MESQDPIFSEINVDSLWLIPERDKRGKHANVYHGNFVPQIPNQLIRRYTKEGDLVLDLFSGSGTTLFECETLKRDFIGFDINPEINHYVETQMQNSKEIQFRLNQCDVTNFASFDSAMQKSLQELGRDHVDFFIAHPPYMDIVKFTDLPEDLSRISDIHIFVEKFNEAIENVWNYLPNNKYFAIVIGDVYKKSEVVPLSFYVMHAIKSHFRVKLKGIIIKNIEGNRGKLGVYNIWKYRALKSDYFLFKHEYIFVFKKVQS